MASGSRGLTTIDPSDPGDHLFARRILRLAGPLDELTAGYLADRLAHLDRSGDETVTLFVDSPGGPVHAAFGLLDIIDVLSAPVDTICVGRAEGTAVAVVASGHRRLAASHAIFRLCEAPVSTSGRPDQVVAAAELHARQTLELAEMVSRATGQPTERVGADLAAGRLLDAGAARAYGLVDNIWAPDRTDREP